ncbi:MAG: single-stranded-DNA-specific exonuclease RecJ [Vicingaceae bacterium]
MEKRWSLKEKAEEKKIQELSDQLNGLNKTLCNLLIQRGIETYQKAKAFFRPSLSALHDPFLMKDMSKAVTRIQTAIKQKEHILIYGDYDVDGTTSVALVYSFLREVYPNLSYYIPDRNKEGYGISKQGIDFAFDKEISLIIALDCGIKAVEKVAYANKKNIDFIICDHHLPGEELPKAHAILDPKQKDCNYPFKELSGCGVGFKLMQAFAEKENIPIKQLHNKLDILAVSICADIVPIVGENRILTHFGLKKLNSNPQAGFKAMLEIANVKKKELTVTDVVFTLAPRINAAGRIESGNKAVEAMLSADAELALESGNYINIQNNERRNFDQAITQEALAMIEADDKLVKQKTTVLFKEDWHKGVIGIVASRCIETYYRPTIILTESNGKASGSARSVKDFSVYEALEQCSELLEQFGGHKYAAGMTMAKENIPAFQAKFEEVVAASIPDKLLIPEIEIDAELELSEISAKFYQILKQFAPYGPENMSPLFLTKHVIEKGAARIVGKNHLKLEIVDPKNPAYFYPAIGFNLGDKIDLIKQQQAFDVVYSIEENEWNGKISLQLNVKDIRPAVNN